MAAFRTPYFYICFLIRHFFEPSEQPEVLYLHLQADTPNKNSIIHHNPLNAHDIEMGEKHKIAWLFLNFRKRIHEAPSSL